MFPTGCIAAGRVGCRAVEKVEGRTFRILTQHVSIARQTELRHAWPEVRHARSCFPQSSVVSHDFLDSNSTSFRCTNRRAQGQTSVPSIPGPTNFVASRDEGKSQIKHARKSAHLHPTLEPRHLPTAICSHGRGPITRPHKLVCSDPSPEHLIHPSKREETTRHVYRSARTHKHHAQFIGFEQFIIWPNLGVLLLSCSLRRTSSSALIPRPDGQQTIIASPRIIRPEKRRRGFYVTRDAQCGSVLTLYTYNP